jgi:branched-chain amino acid transport system permease protein
VLVFWGLQTAFADYGSWYLLALGLIAIAVMLFAPHGLWGLIADKTGLALFPVQRRLSVFGPIPGSSKNHREEVK